MCIVSYYHHVWIFILCFSCFFFFINNKNKSQNLYKKLCILLTVFMMFVYRPGLHVKMQNIKLSMQLYVLDSRYTHKKEEIKILTICNFSYNLFFLNSSLVCGIYELMFKYILSLDLRWVEKSLEVLDIHHIDGSVFFCMIWCWRYAII